MPVEVVMRTEPRVDWEAASERSERIESIRAGLKRCSSVPVRVRRKMFPCFSNVHMVAKVIQNPTSEGRTKKTQMDYASGFNKMIIKQSVTTIQYKNHL